MTQTHKKEWTGSFRRLQTDSSPDEKDSPIAPEKDLSAFSGQRAAMVVEVLSSSGFGSGAVKIFLIDLATHFVRLLLPED